MLRNSLQAPVAALFGLLQILLLWQLLSPSSSFFESGIVWLVLHTFTAVFLGLCAGFWLASKTSLEEKSAALLIAGMSLCMPGIGGLGTVISVLVGQKIWLKRSGEFTDYLVTENTALPFTTPIGRKAKIPDSRGFVEQLRYSGDSSDLYQKVLSSSYIRNSISVDVLREAVTHSDERIRLTAYQILDRKVNQLNQEIQRLEAIVGDGKSELQGITWLQIANNYWELLTLESGDHVAREQLLKKAAQAAKRSVDIDPGNRNAQLVLGRIYIARRDFNAADVALQTALSLGMPSDKVIPYMAEVAFGKREFATVQKLLNSLDDAFKQYPPLKQVAEYWA